MSGMLRAAGRSAGHVARTAAAIAGRRCMSTTQSITKRTEDFSKWYQDVIAEADMVDAGPVRGTVILKPYGFAVWDLLKDELDKRIKATGHTNAYFPMLFPVSFLSKEAAHVEGFAKECAVVTHHRLRLRSDTEEGEGPVIEPDPASQLTEPLVIRPTSETVIWDAYSRWVRTHKDLPLLINQWANVVRWEMRTRPFLRTTEFLWQEGHTAHATRAEALAETHRMLGVYRDVCENVLAMPVTVGRKSPSEKFAGADETLTCEALMQNGWALQAATSHFLGQNFPKAFDVKFADAQGHTSHVWATSWGASTRLVGGLIMSHSDDTGLVLPPAVAPIQAVIMTIAFKKTASRNAELLAAAHQAADALRAAGVRVAVDDEMELNPGARFYKWERKGVPVRIEIGARDLDAGKAVIRPRTSTEKIEAPLASLASHVADALKAVHVSLLDAARKRAAGSTVRISTYSELQDIAAASEVAAAGGVAVPAQAVLAPWACDAANEAAIKAETKYTIRCYPLEEELPAAAGIKCFYSGKPATTLALFARAF